MTYADREVVPLVDCSAAFSVESGRYGYELRHGTARQDGAGKPKSGPAQRRGHHPTGSMA